MLADASIVPQFTRREMKVQVHRTLLSAFENLYAMKALTRFSVGVLGCPVEGSASNLVERFEVGDVKVLVFPAGEPVELRVAAFELGEFTLNILSPESLAAARFGPIQITPGNDVFASWGR